MVGVPGRVIKTIDVYAEQHVHDFMNTKFMSPREKRKTVEKALFRSIRGCNEELGMMH